MELRTYGTQTTVYFPLITVDDTEFDTGLTHASGDTQVSKDGGAFANTSNSFSHVGNGIYSLTLTATEMQASQVVLTIIDQSTKAWEDQAVIITTINNASAEIPQYDANVTQVSGDSTAADNLESDYDGTGYSKTNSTIGTATDVTNAVSADVTQISGDATAADNLESDYDGTGYDKSNSKIGEATTLPSAERNSIADALLTRSVSNTEGSAGFHTLTGGILKLTGKFKGSTGETFQTDGSTVFMTQATSTDSAADPIVEIGDPS